MQTAPDHPSLQFHKITRSRDDGFASVRAGRDLRIIVHRSRIGGQASLMIAYAAHHDDAYDWAERRRVEVHPRTRTAQIVEVRELVREAEPEPSTDLFAVPDVVPESATVEPGPPALEGLDADALGSIGVPQDWVADLLASDEDELLSLCAHIPGEAAEALVAYAAEGTPLQPPVPVPDVDPFQQPDALRRFRVVDSDADLAELTRALEYPWDRWILYLHPSQRSVVERSFNGPARVAGSAGTGKTVVALHRAARLLRADPTNRVLLTTFSEPLARMLERKLALLLDDTTLAERATVASFAAVARDVVTLAEGTPPLMASEAQQREFLRSALQENDPGMPERFVWAEWSQVVDAWQVETLEDYAVLPRLGRRTRLGAKQRERLWTVFQSMRERLRRSRRSTLPMVYKAAASTTSKPFTHIVVDEAQDLGVAQLRMLAALAPEGRDRLFFAGDLGQRIFQEPFSWAGLGIDVRGRSRTLKVNYRTSHQIRRTVDRLLPPALRDVDGVEEDRRATVSVFNGPEPQVVLFQKEAEEIEAVLGIIDALDAEGIEREQIGVFVRSPSYLGRARMVAERREGVVVETMHLAKGLEFRAVIVMACDEDALPLAERVEAAQDERELNEIFETERHLLYVACTRARDRLYVTGLKPGSEYLADLLPVA